MPPFARGTPVTKSVSLSRCFQIHKHDNQQPGIVSSKMRPTATQLRQAVQQSCCKSTSKPLKSSAGRTGELAFTCRGGRSRKGVAKQHSSGGARLDCHLLRLSPEKCSRQVTLFGIGPTPAAAVIRPLRLDGRIVNRVNTK